MIDITLTPRQASALREGAKPVALNLDAVLDLGNVLYFAFRGRAYGVPPLPWRAGEAILAAVTESESYGSKITQENLTPYFRCIAKLQHLIWKNVFPGSKWLRMARRFGLLPNPFRNATEREVGEIALFLSERRMSSHGLVPLKVAQKNRHLAIS